MKKRIFGRMIKKLKWLVIISVVLVALGTVGIGIASVYHMKYALKSLFNMEFTREMIRGPLETSHSIIKSGNGRLR